MNVMRFNNDRSTQALIASKADVPQPGNGEVLIRVHAAGVTPTELQWYPTTHTKAGEARVGAVPGHEFSGVVAEIGENVPDFAPGQEVYGMNDWFADGATAEFCLTVPSFIAPRPRRLTHAEAASVPIGALTAWQGLFDRAKLQSGERVLIHGGAGAVGVFAIQLARRAGAEVIATGSARNLDFLRVLGASQVIDYRGERFEKAVAPVDVVFDSVGGETLERSWSLLKPGGRMVTIAAQGEEAGEARVKDAFFIVEPKRGQLIEISKLLDDGALKTFVDGPVSLAEASTAYTGSLTRKYGRGKVVVAILEES